MLTEQQRQEFEAIVGRWYPIARRGILLYEAEEGRKAIEAITELRDALDHYWMATTETNESAIAKHFRMVEDHLRSAAVEPMERAVEQRLYVVLLAHQNVGGLRRLLWHLLFLKPPRPEQAYKLEKEVRDEIRSGRQKKSTPATASEAVDHFKTAHDKVKELEALFQGPQIDERRYQLLLSIITLAIGYALGKWL